VSNANVSVNVFNAGATTIQVSVNGGSPISIAGTGPSQNWAPQQPSNPPSYTNGYPASNVFGSMGMNQVLVMANGSPLGQPLSISIPQRGPVFSLQLYIFFSGSSASWTLLSNGQVIAAGQGIDNT
jgi:hypothetical protein